MNENGINPRARLEMPADDLPPRSRAADFLRRTVSGAKSASRRYPQELWRSLREAPAWGCADEVTRAALDRLGRARFGAAWLGHATVLVRLGDDLVLADPVLSDRIGPRIGGRSIGLGRLAPAPVGPADLEPPTVILLSHAHFDHLDRPTLQALASPAVRVVTAPGTRGLIPRGFGQVDELPPGDSLTIGALRFTAIRPNHWGARTALDTDRGYNSYLIESLSGRPRRVLFGGDTAMTNAFDGLKADLAILGIGGYQPWVHAHATPEQVWEMVQRARADRLIPIHHSTFPLSSEPITEPLERLSDTAGASFDRVAVLRPGEALID